MPSGCQCRHHCGSDLLPQIPAAFVVQRLDHEVVTRLAASASVAPLLHAAHEGPRFGSVVQQADQKRNGAASQAAPPDKLGPVLQRGDDLEHLLARSADARRAPGSSPARPS